MLTGNRVNNFVSLPSWSLIGLQLMAVTILLLSSATMSFTILKRAQGGNPCPDPEKPFPCKRSMTCIPMAYVCDNNEDCEDAYDENPDVCTAVKRPPVEDILSFLKSEDWMVDSMFAGKNLQTVAHGLAVSQSIHDLRRRLQLNDEQVQNFKTVLDAVKGGHEAALESLGMPSSSWKDISFMFGKLVASGFAA